MKPYLPLIALTLVLLLVGCVSKESQTIAKIFDVEKIPYTAVQVKGDTLQVTYEASSADEYDSQIVADWGTIFGIAANMPYEKIVIINTINDIPTAELAASRENIRAYLDGTINETQFWERVDITAS